MARVSEGRQVAHRWGLNPTLSGQPSCGRGGRAGQNREGGWGWQRLPCRVHMDHGKRKEQLDPQLIHISWSVRRATWKMLLLKLLCDGTCRPGLASFMASPGTQQGPGGAGATPPPASPALAQHSIQPQQRWC